jgi:CRISPR/Cas system type I-B associated protein Csh2 (Cas7 group RAMP superfamily)
MGFMDKAREAAGQAAARAEQAATDARGRVTDVQTKRDLNAAYQDLGRAAYTLAQAGQLTHPDLQPAVDRVTELELDDGGPAAAA